jgi:DNA-damage-inducible protein J
MSKTAMIRARIEPEIKEKAEAILAKLGISASDAIGIFYAQIAMQRRIPFDVALPNRKTRKTLEDTRRGKNLVHSETKEEMFKKLGL